MKLTLPFPPSVNSYWRAPSKGPLKGRHLVSETGRKFQKAARAAIIEQLRAVPRPSSELAEVHIVLYPPDQCGEVIIYAWMDRRRENSEKPYGTRLGAGQAVSARLVGK